MSSQEQLAEAQRRFSDLLDRLGLIIGEEHRILGEELRIVSEGLTDIGRILGIVPAAPSPAAPEERKFRVAPTVELEAVARPVVVPRFLSQLDALQFIAQQFAAGVKQKPFDRHRFFVAAEVLDNRGNVTDLKQTVDFIMVFPSIDAQIEFDRDVEAATPSVTGGTIFRIGLNVRTIHHKAVSTTLKGTLSIWAAWYSG